MSLLKSLVSTVKSVISSPIAKVVGTALGGPVGVTLAAASTAYGAYQALKPAPMASIQGAPVIPGAGSMGMGMSLMPSLGRAAAVGGGMVVRGAKSVYNAAAGYCRKHPQWCSTIGGIAAVEALVSSGQLPIPKRRRGKGISATELKNFRRVARFTSKYCAPVRRAMSSKAVRGGKSCR